MSTTPEVHWLKRGALALVLLLLAAGLATLGSIAWYEWLGRGGISPYKAVSGSTLDRVFSPDELAEDLDDLFIALGEVHPDLTHATSLEELEAARDRARLALGTPMTRVEAWPSFAGLAAWVVDAHTSVPYPSEEETRALQAGEPVLPLLVEVGVDVRVVRSLGEEDVPEGSVLRAIGGRSIDDLRAEWRARTGQPEALFRNDLGQRFARHVYAAGLRAPFVVGFSDPETDAVSEVTFAGVSYDAARFNPRRVEHPWNFEDLGDGVGRIDFVKMKDEGAFISFLDDTFATLNTGDYSALIIDMRQNGGGRSVLGQHLIQRFAKTRYRMSSRKEWRASARMKDFFRDHALPAAIRWLPEAWLPQIGVFFTLSDGAILTQTSGWIEPWPADRRFAGEVCVLIGKRTFSSALMTVNAIEDHGLATLIGEETGDAPNHFGELCMFRLPNTKLLVRISSARFVRANGDAADRRGVLPDIEVRDEPGEDAVMRAALDWAR